MKTYEIKVTVGMEFDDILNLDLDTPQEVQSRMKTYVESLLFEAINTKNIALDVRVTAHQINQVGRAAPQDGL